MRQKITSNFLKIYIISVVIPIVTITPVIKAILSSEIAHLIHPPTQITDIMNF